MFLLFGLSACTITIIEPSQPSSSNESQVSENVSIETSEGSSEQTSQPSESGSQSQSDTESTVESQESTQPGSQESQGGQSEESTTPQQSEESVPAQSEESQEPESVTPQSEESQEDESITPTGDPDFVTEGNEFQLVTNLDTQLHVGYRYVIASAKDGEADFMSNAENQNNRRATPATISNSKVTLTEDMMNLVLEDDGDGDYKFRAVNYKETNTYYFSASAKDNKLLMSTSPTYGSFQMELESDGSINIYSVEETTTVEKGFLRYNYNGGSSLFSLYAETSDLPKVYLFRGSETAEYNPGELEGIELSGTMSKTDYKVGDDWSTAGLTVTATYSLAGEKDVTSQVEWTFTPAKPDSTSITSVQVVATFKDQTDSESFNVTVTETSSSAVTLEVSMQDYLTENGCTLSVGSDVTNYKTLTLDSVVTMSTTGGGNCGSFWNNPAEWRIYQAQTGDITISLATGYEIESITFTYGKSNGGVIKDGTTQISSGSKYSPSSSVSSKTFTIGNTGTAGNGQVKITAVSIVYIAQ